MSEIEWRNLICSDLTCAWESSQPFLINFKPESLQFQQSWRLINSSSDELTVNYKFAHHGNFNYYLQPTLWLSISHDASTASTLVANDAMFQLENLTWQIAVAASDSAIINFQWTNKNWHYLLSQKAQNHTMSYDWLIKINRKNEATPVASLIESPLATPEATIDDQLELEVSQPIVESNKELKQVTLDSHNHLATLNLVESDNLTHHLQNSNSIDSLPPVNQESSDYYFFTSGNQLLSTATTAASQSQPADLLTGFEATVSTQLPAVLGLETKAVTHWWWLLFLLIFLTIGVAFVWWYQWLKSFDFSRLA